MVIYLPESERVRRRQGRNAGYLSEVVEFKMTSRRETELVVMMDR